MCKKCDMRRPNWITVNPKTVTYYVDDLGETLFVFRCIFKSWSLEQYTHWLDGDENTEEFPYMVEVYKRCECPDCGKTYVMKASCAYFDIETDCIMFMQGFGFGSNLTEIDGVTMYRDFMNWSCISDSDDVMVGDVEDYCVKPSHKFRVWSCVVDHADLPSNWVRLLRESGINVAFIKHFGIYTDHYHFLFQYPYPVSRETVFADFGSISDEFISVHSLIRALNYMALSDGANVDDMCIFGDFEEARKWWAGVKDGA